MEIFLKATLILHIICGFASLLTGTLIAVLKKGDKRHRMLGRVFFFGMIGVSISAVIISIAKNNQFLLLIGIFSFYLNFGGYRAIKEKTLKPAIADWLVLALGAGNGFFMIYSMNTVLMVFGGLTFFIAISQFRINLKASHGQELGGKEWLKRHIGMMTGAFIATVTAFVVVNIRLGEDSLIPAWLPWLAPSMILGPMIGIWTRKYTGKKKAKTA
jgi:uncharacterized membrane protein